MSNDMSMTIKGFKGFNNDMTCQGHKFKVGKTYKHEGVVKLCAFGYHFCENPLDVFTYYKPGTSKFHEVNAEDVSDQKDSDSKRVAGCITVGCSLGFHAIVSAAVTWIKSKTKPTAGHYAHAATAGNSAHAATSGDYAHAATAGHYAHAATSGSCSIAVALGNVGAAKAKLGSWIVLVEYDVDGRVVLVKTDQVDGKRIKADTFYSLKNGKFIEIKE